MTILAAERLYRDIKQPRVTPRQSLMASYVLVTTDHPPTDTVLRATSFRYTTTLFVSSGSFSEGSDRSGVVSDDYARHGIIP